MSLEMKAINKRDLITQTPPIATKSKYSLKDHSFQKGMPSSNTTRGFKMERMQLNQFVSFISEHNQQLATKNNLISPIKLQATEDAFNCFQGCTTSAFSQTFIARMKSPDHRPTSTLSSSNVSEIATQIAHASQKSYSNNTFKINTRSLLQNLIMEGYCTSTQNRTTKDFTQGNTNPAFISAEGLCTRQRKSNSHNQPSHNKKISLKTNKYKLNYRQEQLLQRKESLNYNQLCNPLRISGELQLNESFTHQNISISEQAEQNSPLIKIQKRRKYSEYKSDSLLERWLRQPQVRYARARKGDAVDEKTLTQINKDVPRTPYSKSTYPSQYHQKLKHILVDYWLLNPQIGYVQGMNFIASAILYHCDDVKSGSLLFNYLMIDNKFQEMYQAGFTLMARLAKQLWQEVQKYSQKLSSHINSCGVGLEMLARSWYLSMLGSFVPLYAMDLVIDKFLRKNFRGINQIVLTLLIYLKQQLLSCDPGDLMLKLSTSELAKRAQGIDWDQLVACSENLFLQNLAI